MAAIVGRLRGHRRQLWDKQLSARAMSLSCSGKAIVQNALHANDRLCGTLRHMTQDAPPAFVHHVFINGELKYQFMESIWYDTASPAQACIARLREIKNELPGVVICGLGHEYKIDTLDELKHWTKEVFSPTGCWYVCDFSEYL